MGAGTSGFRVGLSVMTSMFPYRDSLLFCQGQFLFSLQLFVLQSYCTLKVYKFFGSISGVVSKNTACILKMILE